MNQALIATDIITVQQAAAMNSTHYTAPQPCRACKYRKHCSGERDRITGATDTSGDSCEVYDNYIPQHPRVKPGMNRTPYRVLGAMKLWGIKS